MTRVIYIGERVNIIGGIQQVFKDRKGRLHRFSGLKGLWVGSVYEIAEDNTMLRRPKAVEAKGFVLTEQELLESEAQKEICKAQRELRKKAAALKKPHADIVRAINLLRPFYLSLSDFDRSRFAQYLTNAMSKKGPRK